MNIALLTLLQTTLKLQGESPTYVLNKDTHPAIRAIGVSPTACENMSFDELIDLTAGECIVIFYNTW